MKPLNMKRRLGSWAVWIFVCGVGMGGAAAEAGDWPQVLGPARDGQAVGERLRVWEEAPKVLWRHSCGAGYAGVAVAEGRVYLWHRRDDSEVIECLSSEDGAVMWSRTFPAVYRGGVDPDTGPRCVPVVHGDAVVLHGAGGDVHVLSASDGEVRWSRELRTDLGADDGYFGAGSTPLVLADRVIVEVGARRGAGLVALRLSDGQLLWKTLDSEAAYASPVVVERGGKTLVLAPMRLQTFLVDPADGNTLSRFDFGRRGPSVVAATPLIDGSTALLTASYGVGCRLMDLSTEPPVNRWSDTDVISSQYATPVRVADHVYAITGREDFSNAGLVCVDWKDGRQRWAEADFGTAHLIAAGTEVLAVGVDGRLDLFRADPNRFDRAATMELPAGTYRSLPALAAGRLYLRRSQSADRGELIVLDVGTR